VSCAPSGNQITSSQLISQYRDEQQGSEHRSTSSQSTAKPASSSKSKRRKTIGSGKVIHAVASNVHITGKNTPVLLRDHVHATDPATPQQSEDTKKSGEADLNLDLQELGLEDTVIRPDLLHKLERIGSGGFKE
jgi:PAB1-binding protein PBP1